jgi:ketosteroid isomerase-like protein
MTHKIEVPQVVKDFISAVNAHDINALSKTFADDALKATRSSAC